MRDSRGSRHQHPGEQNRGGVALDEHPGEVFRRWLDDVVLLVTSEYILSELVSALGKPYIRRRVSLTRSARFQALIRRQATVTPILDPLHGVASHAQDDTVIATAVSGMAKFLVTGDADLLRLGRYGRVRIVTPRAFLDLLDDAPPETRRPSEPTQA